ncbi:MAG: hypothetical protein ABSB74_13900 [Tepidisphaeraceae bacterium]
MAGEWIKTRIAGAVREYARLDLRASHIIVAAMIVAGALTNIIVAHGWTVWPFVGAFGILTYINEAADRNGQGIPPFQVYAFFFGAVALWILMVIFLSTINPVVVILGIIAMGYRAGQAFIRQRERDRLIAARRANGLCIHRGESFDPNVLLCESCGEEPNPDEALLKRVAQIYRSPEEMARTRATLSRAATNASAKEAALLARHRSGKATAPAPLPKAAKLGGSAGGASRKPNRN